MPRPVLLVTIATALGALITVVGFWVSPPVDSYIMAPGVSMAFWLCSGRVHELGYAVLSVVINGLVYSVLSFCALRFALRGRPPASE
jgi:hypothetical protein